MTDTPDNVDDMLADCFFAIGQAVGRERPIDYAAIAWWHARYRGFFELALARGNSWVADRRRVTAVARYLGQRAADHAGARASIDCLAAAHASLAVERGCQMQAERHDRPNTTARAAATGLQLTLA